MTRPATRTVEEAIRHAGEGWVIDSFTPTEGAVPFLLQKLTDVDSLARQRLGKNAPDLSEASLVAMYNSNPLKVKGFFQVLGGTRSSEMLLMTWRIIQGMEIKDIAISYERQKQFHARVVLESPYGEVDEPYESSSIQDFALFRHIGIMEISGLPVFDGFYALKLKT